LRTAFALEYDATARCIAAWMLRVNRKSAEQLAVLSNYLIAGFTRIRADIVQI